MIHYEKGEVTVRDAVGSDVFILAGKLRRKDAEEVRATGAQSIDEELADSFAHSVLRYTIERAGVPVAMFGIRPDTLIGDKALVWLLGTDELAKIKKTFVRGTGVFLNRFLEQYPVLYNAVDARYGETVRWLEAFGARFSEPVNGPTGVQFVGFIIRRS
jgi:hypothetical protein